VVSGSPAIDNRAWLKSSAAFARLPELQKRVRELERRLGELMGRADK
jgi:UDP-3-O-[3-hydroxymyristoyl] glucosamine N-acyltransferase